MLPVLAKKSEPSSLVSDQTCQHFSLADIRSATQNFKEERVIGRGGFGKVYIGHIINHGSAIIAAIKRLNSTSLQGAGEFRVEVEMLSKLRHCNLVSLIGYCNEGTEMILVYDYMPHGTLEDHLHKSELPLSWLQRLKICIGAARGLEYLHTGTGTQHGVIHRDVKSSNILLDQNFAAKISDFGLAKIGPTNQTRTYVSTGVKGTFGYMDPYYFYTGKLTRKSDVYSFGVVLLEVICGKRAVDSSLDEEQWGLAIWAQDRIKEGKLNRITDSTLRGQISSNCLKQFAHIACRCLRNQPNQRPTMAEIIVRLELILSLQERLYSSLTDGKFINKLRSVFPSKVQLKASKMLSVSTVSSEPEVGSRSEVAGQLIHFDACTFKAEDLIEAAAEIINTRYYGTAYRLIMESGEQFLVTRLKSHLLLEEDIVIEKIHAVGKLWHTNILVPNAYYHSKYTKFFVNNYIHLTGSISSFLTNSEGPLPKPFDWSTGMGIIVGITRGLVYLHNQENIVHGYLTSQNVLLDRTYNPFIADIGLSLLLKDGFKFEEHVNMKKDDVYGLGLIMLELLTTKSTNLGKEGNDLQAWVMSRPREESSELVVCMQELARSCASLSPDARPTAVQVLQKLEEIVAISEEERERIV